VISKLTGQVILIEVIQVNCPGCFIHALPETIRLHETYKPQGLKVFAIVTAFEHFEHNTLNNLQRLLSTGELQGDPPFQCCHGQTGKNKAAVIKRMNVSYIKIVIYRRGRSCVSILLRH
jgi:hypothetical protein